jgi:hypothetical protein
MPLDGSPIGARLRALLTRAQVDVAVELTCSSAIASPVALPGNEVCLPRRALLELQPVEQDSMLAHAVAHLVRRDPQWLIAARAIEMVWFFQPLNRLARRRMQEVAEYLCDDWAVARTRQPVTLAKCLAAVAEWVGRAPKTDTPRLAPLSAMVEASGSPLVRRVGRILSGRGTSAARTPRVAFAGAVCALVVLGAVVPRVSVASAAGLERRFTFLRTVGTSNGGLARRDTVILFRTGHARIAIDSMIRQRGAAAGELNNPTDVIYQRITVESERGDTIPAGVMWTRRVLPPIESGFPEVHALPLIDVERAGLLVVGPRGER